MKALLAAGALCVSLAIAVPLSLAQTTPPAASSTTQSTTVTTPATPTTPPSTTTSHSTTSTTPMPGGGSQTTTQSTSTTTTPGSCHTHHADGEICSCLKAPTTMGTAQNNRCVIGGGQ